MHFSYAWMYSASMLEGCVVLLVEKLEMVCMMGSFVIGFYEGLGITVNLSINEVYVMLRRMDIKCMPQISFLFSRPRTPTNFSKCIVINQKKKKNCPCNKIWNTKQRK